MSDAHITRGRIRSLDNLRFPHEAILKDGPRSVKKAKATFIDRHRDGTYKQTSIQLIHEHRQGASSPWLTDPGFSLIGEEIDLLQSYINQVREVQGLPTGANYVLLPVDTAAAPLAGPELSRVLQVLKEAASAGTLQGVFQTAKLDPITLENIGAAVRHTRYKQALTEFEALVEANAAEHDLRIWIKQNHWVFGTEYVATPKARRVGLRSEIDIMLESVDGFCDIIELKRPGTLVLREDKSRHHWYPSDDLSNVVGQVIDYLRDADDYRLHIEEAEELTLLKPRARIVIGRSRQWGLGERRALRALNAQFANIDVMTFDELLKRGRELIDLYSAGTEQATVSKVGQSSPLPGE